MKHAANRVLNLLRKRFDPYTAYRREIRKRESPENKGGGRVLIAIIGGAYGHLFEGLLARKAALQGDEVFILRCGGFLKYCDLVNVELSHKKLRCQVCQAQQEDFIRAFGGTDCPYERYILPEDQALFAEYVEEFFRHPKERHIYRGTAIDEILYTALQRYYLIAAPEVRDDAVTRGFLQTILSTLTVMDRLCAEIKPQVVITSHGTYSTWGSVLGYCRAKGIYVVTHGQNYNKNGIEFTYNDTCLRPHPSGEDSAWRQTPLTPEQRKVVQRFLDERLGRVRDSDVTFDYNKDRRTAYTAQEIREMLHIDASKKVVGLFPNIPWDGALTGESMVFPNFRDWLKATVDYFSNQEDAVLVIRSHPAELLRGDAAGHETTATMLGEMYAALPDQIRLLPPDHPVNSYVLGAAMDFGITYSSTVTLELIYLGKPVILCGCPPFQGEDVAFEINSKEQYLQRIEQGMRGELQVDRERAERLLRFVHKHFFVRTMPQTLVQVKDTIPERLLFKSEEDLDRDAVFDEMYRCIKEQKPMNFSRFYRQDSECS